MHQSDTGPGYYQYYQSQFQNPNPNSTDPLPPPLQPNSFGPPPPPPAAAPTFASAPPVASSHSDYSSYYPSSNSSSYPPYPQSTDQTLNPQPLSYPPSLNVQSSNPSPQPYNFPHLNPPAPAAPPYYGYDQNQASLGYDHLNPSYNSNPNPGLSANAYAPPTNHGGGGYESASNYGAYGDVGKPRTEVGAGYEYGGYQDEGVYQYSGGKVEPYGARGTGTKSSSSSSSGVIFDDYGRPIGFENEKKQNGSGSTGRIVKAVPKAETQQDTNSGVQKYRVKVLSEGAGQSDMDVLCQVGLDGIRLLDTATGRTLRIYPLETVTRCEVLDSYIFAFWAKTSVDMDAKRIRLKSNSYTTNNILDTVTAATFQIKEIGVRNDSSNAPKLSEQQQSERRKGLADWVNLMKPRNEEKEHWVPDEAVAKCTSCASDFGAFLRRHHCRNCGEIFCDKCTQGRIALTEEEGALPVRVCDRCMAEVTQRLANAKQSVGKGSALQSHADLARKLKEEMDKNRKTSTGFTSSNGSGTRTKDVACPTCTVHLQVQVPSSGSETIECSVCQHPFLVSAH